MITQGFPLYAVGRDGAAYAVVGWTDAERGNIAYPALVPLDVEARGAVVGDSDGGVCRYTTTDPRKRPDENAMAYKLADLEQRLHARLDEIGKTYDADARWAAAQIRKELDR